MFTKIPSFLRSYDLILAVLAITAVVLAGCTGEDATPQENATSTTVASTVAPSVNEDIVFGSGVLPSSVPADFPIPEQAVIGSTLVDTPRGITEVILTYPADVVSVADFYATNLPALGYTVDSSAGSDASWEIAFSKDDLTGVVIVSTGGSGLSQGALRLVVPVSG